MISLPVFKKIVKLTDITKNVYIEVKSPVDIVQQPVQVFVIWPTNHLNTVGARHIDARERRRYA